VSDRPPGPGRECAEDASLQRRLREEYESDRLYPVAGICLKPSATGARTYAEELLADKLRTVRRHQQAGLALDLCCATGEHLRAVGGAPGTGVGIDFSRPYIEEARRRESSLDLPNHYLVGDATTLPLADASIATAWCFSALYALPHADRVVNELARVLQPGGTCVLDFGNRRSLNRFCLRYYPEYPPTFHLSRGEIRRLCQAAGLDIIEWRCFQLLPLWAGRPNWLWPLLHPVWQRWLKTRIAGRMLDEWVSSLPGIRHLAFRQLVVCRKA
jgi:SAM-dependent methyltransferase